ncbi:MAG: DUF2793 domain-containing protein [Parvularculaceae bacterium]|nr:DUF2793 domain-containing protein [Parvularculaceae bacterium]
MQNSPRLKLPYLAPQQSQKHVTVNEGLRRLDALAQLSVISASLIAEPAAPLDGDAYILTVGATGAQWPAFAPQSIAVFQDGAWIEIEASAGLRAHVADEGAFRFFDGACWRGEQSGENLLINPDLAVNQRVFAGGALAAGAYGFDRWRGAAGGAVVTRNGAGVVTLSSGAIAQTIEPGLFGVVDFSGHVLTASLAGHSGGDVTITIDGFSRTLSATTPCATFAVASNGPLAVELKAATGAASFRSVKVELGAAASAHKRRLGPVELALCQRYFSKSFGAATAPADGVSANTQWGAITAAAAGFGATGNIYLPQPMRIAPAITFYRLSLGTQNGKWNYVKAGAWSDDVTATAAVGVTETQFRVRLDAAGSNPFAAQSSYSVGGDWTASAEF